MTASEWLLGLDLEYLRGLNAESLGDAFGPRCQPSASTACGVFAEWHRYRNTRDGGTPNKLPPSSQ